MKNMLFNFIGRVHALQILPGGESAGWTLEDFFGKSGSLLDNVLNIALTLGGGIAVIFVLIGAFYYFTAYGNEEKANKGKTTITWALIGVAVIVLSKLLINVMLNLIYK